MTIHITIEVPAGIDREAVIERTRYHSELLGVLDKRRVVSGEKVTIPVYDDQTFRIFETMKDEWEPVHPGDKRPGRNGG